MPFARYDETMAALDQQWMFGPQAGANYRQALALKFATVGNKQAIEDALSLGAYLQHNQENQNRRTAMRAVLLANFLMGGATVQQVGALKSRVKGLDIDALKRAFKHRFPALQDNGNRAAWAAANMTDPATLNTLRRVRTAGMPPAALPAFRFIIHAVGNFMGDVFDNPMILSRYEVLSMSLMSNRNAHAHDPQGVILRVPANNILAAAHTDVAVLNYAPAFDPAVPNAVTITENLMDVAARMGGISTPAQVLDNVRGYPYYNEVVVCGRSGVPLPHGQTANMQLVGMYMLTNMNGELNGQVNNRKERELRVKSSALANGVPLIYIPNRPEQPNA